jgi:serine/threonine-protein kinase
MTAKASEHPNVTNIYDIGFFEGKLFLVEEYLSGEDLRDKIHRRDPITLKDKISYLLAVAKGLKFAHSKGIVHRDIKPENIRVLESGQVKIMDFGIGRVVTSEGTRLTLKGTLMGTLGYLAPEQLKDESDERTDIFAFGVVAYEFLTYTHPFSAETPREQFQALLSTSPPPISDLTDDLDPRLVSLIDQCIAKAPDDRPQSFESVTSNLRQVLADLNQPEHVTAESQTANKTVILDASGLAELTRAARAAEEMGQESQPEEPQSAEVLPVPEEKIAEPETTPQAAAPADVVTEDQDSTEPAAPAPLAKARPAEIPSPVEKRAGLRGIWVKSKLWDLRLLRVLALIGTAAVVAVLVVGLLRLVSPTPSKPPAVADVDADPAAASLDVTPETGSVFVDAFPWGQITRVLNSRDEEITVPEAAVTPYQLELPAGDYRITLFNPDSTGKEQVCAITISAGAGAVCRVEFMQMTTLDFFKESGWWN